MSTAFEAEMPERLKLMQSAAVWYTEVGFTILRIHYPRSLRKTVGSTLTGGCSCGKMYQIKDGVVSKEDSGCKSPAKHPVMLPGRAASYISVVGEEPGPHGDGVTWHRDPAMHARNPAEALELWAEKPYNIGVLVGEEYGTFVIDIDTKTPVEPGKKMPEGLLTWQKIATAVPELADTMAERTSGPDEEMAGWHFFYKIEDPEVWKILKRLPASYKHADFLAKARQAVVAPSVHATGTVYKRDPRGGAAPLLMTQALAERLLAFISERVAEDRPSIFGSSDLATSGANGDWMAQVKHLLAYDAPMKTYGPGEHNDSLKPLFGAAVAMGDMITPDVAEYYKTMMEADPSWIPPYYLWICQHIDANVTKPVPWWESDRGNMVGLVRSAVKREMDKVLGAHAWATGKLAKPVEEVQK